MPDPNQTDPNQNQINPAPTAGVPSEPVVPSFSPQSDLPPLPPDFQNVANNPVPPTPATTTTVTETTTTSTEPVTQVGTAAPSDLPPISGPKKKFGSGRIIATILGLFLLVGGVGAGIILTQQQQIVAPKAVGNGECACKDKDTGVVTVGTCNADGSCTCTGNTNPGTNKCPGAPAPTAAGGVAGCVFDHYSVKQACVQVNGVWKKCDTTPVGENGYQAANCNMCDTAHPVCGSAGSNGNIFCLAVAPPYCTPQGVAAVDAGSCTSGAGCGGSTPTPPPSSVLMCRSLSSNIAQPKLGDKLSLTCDAGNTTGSSVAYFRYKVDAGPWVEDTKQSVVNASNHIATRFELADIYKPGAWQWQCRICKDTTKANCSTWGVAN